MKQGKKSRRAAAPPVSAAIPGAPEKDANAVKDEPGAGPPGESAPPDSGSASKPAEGARRRSTLSAIGKFISTNTNFFSSFVIGIAGVLATSTYQCNQSKLAERQADLQARMAREQADNTWKIERAKILSQNLQTLTARGGDTVEQRYGVLLSLSRGNILDPDVSMSYALELGRDNPEYMRSVLSNIEHKDEPYYRRLLAAYWVTCANRYGVRAPGLDACKSDILDPRSNALEQVVADELEALMTTADRLDGPMILLRDEREVHANLLKLTGLFEEFLQDVFERRQWTPIQRFLDYSKGARLVGALVLAMQIGAAGANAAIADREQEEHAKFKKLHADLQQYFATFLIGPECDPDCRARVAGYLLTNLTKGQPLFIPALRLLLARPRAEAEAVLARLNSRLTWCQADIDDQVLVRDKVLTPLLADQLQQAKPDMLTIDDLVGLLALIPEPTEPTPLAMWRTTMDTLAKFTGGRYPKQLADRRAAALQLRLSAEPQKGKEKVPTLAGKRRASFCRVAVEDRDDSEEE